MTVFNSDACNTRLYVTKLLCVYIHIFVRQNTFCMSGQCNVEWLNISNSVFIIFVVYKSISMLIVEVWENAENDKVETQNHSLSYHRYP